jgi:hypothetical protein
MKMKGMMIGSALLPFLFLSVPFIIQWSPLDNLIPYDVDHPYTPLVWPGVVVVVAVAVVIAACIKQDWPARTFTQWFNVAVSIVAALMTLVMIGFALNPT